MKENISNRTDLSLLSERILDIRYVRLRFTIRMEEECELPLHKASMFRGGMGQVLLDVNCVHSPRGVCEECGFEQECLVRRIMYAKPRIQPQNMSGVDSVGYVLDCEDSRECFQRGDTLSFHVTLFGYTIVYLSQFLNAFITLGQRGVGKERARYQICAVTTDGGKELLTENGVQISQYRVRTLKEYIDYRKKQCTASKDKTEQAGSEDSTKQGTWMIRFLSPLSLKYQGKELAHFDIRALVTAAARRIYILDCFEGIDTEQLDLRECPMPDEMRENHREVRVSRYSGRQQARMTLHGIRGELVIGPMEETLLEIILAGELLHVGKNTSFGFGRYRLEPGTE